MSHLLSLPTQFFNNQKIQNKAMWEALHITGLNRAGIYRDRCIPFLEQVQDLICPVAPLGCVYWSG